MRWLIAPIAVLIGTSMPVHSEEVDSPPLICIGQKEVVVQRVSDLDRVPDSVAQRIEALRAEGFTRFSVWVAYDLCAGSSDGDMFGFLETVTYRVVPEE